LEVEEHEWKAEAFELAQHSQRMEKTSTWQFKEQGGLHVAADKDCCLDRLLPPHLRGREFGKYHAVLQRALIAELLLNGCHSCFVVAGAELHKFAVIRRLKHQQKHEIHSIPGVRAALQGMDSPSVVGCQD
jgi:hypothetical protein